MGESTVSPRIFEYTKRREQDQIEREMKCAEVGSVVNKKQVKRIMLSKEEKYDPKVFLELLKNWTWEF